MNKTPVPIKTRKTALALLSETLSVPAEELKATLKATAFKECKTDAEFMAAVVVAQSYGLNPFLKEIYAFPSKGGAVIPCVPVDGWISLVNRQANFDGVELIENEDADGELKSVTAIFHLKDKNNPIKVTEYMKECFDGSKEPWKRWPRRMLRHKAYIQGARVAFGFSGIYDPDEGDRIIDVTGTATESRPDIKPPQSMSQTGGSAGGPEAGRAGGNGSPNADQQNPFKNMLEEFATCKKALGDKKYYEILGGEGFEHADEIRVVSKGNLILTVMKQAIKDIP